VTAFAVARYLLSDAYRSQRVLLPIVLQLAVLAVLFGGDPGPLPTPWAASALALYPVSTWLALTIANTEDPVQRSVTVAAAGGPGPVVRGTALVALAGVVLLTALSVGWGVAAARGASAAHLAEGILCHLAAGATGTAVGLLVARPIVMRIGWSLVIGLVVVLSTAVQSWLPPVGAAVAALTADRGPSAFLVPLLVAFALVGAAVWLSTSAARRG
jgi:hypothetical protein